MHQRVQALVRGMIKALTINPLKVLLLNGKWQSPWLLSLPLVTDAPTIAVSLDATSAPAAGPTVTVDRTSVSSTDLLFNFFNNANNQDGHASGTTAAPSVEKTASASPEKRNSVSICVHVCSWLISSPPFSFHPPVWPDLLSSQLGVSCVGDELTSFSSLVEVETTDCVSYFNYLLLTFVKL